MILSREEGRSGNPQFRSSVLMEIGNNVDQIVITNS
jgi:hypothetical protein